MNAEDFEVRCTQCGAGFAIGTRRCVHCGGRLAKNGSATSPAYGLPEPGVEDVDAADETPAEGGRGGLMSLLPGLAMAAVVVVTSIMRSCGGP
jgi:hypothetical protein